MGLKHARSLIKVGGQCNLGIKKSQIIVVSNKFIPEEEATKYGYILPTPLKFISVFSTMAKVFQDNMLQSDNALCPYLGTSLYFVYLHYYCRNILVADDTECVRSALVRQIKLIDGKHNITECENGLKALEILKDRHDTFHLAIIDNRMPDMNGSEVIHSVRNFEQEKNLKQLAILCINKRA